MTTPEQRAREMLAGVYASHGHADRQGQPMVDKPGPKWEFAVEAMLSFACAELERAAVEVGLRVIKDPEVDAWTAQSVNQAFLATARAIRNLKHTGEQ